MAERLPLAGKTIVVTRPERQSLAISQRLSELGAKVIKFPLIAIEAIPNKPIIKGATPKSKESQRNNLRIKKIKAIIMEIKLVQNPINVIILSGILECFITPSIPISYSE